MDGTLIFGLPAICGVIPLVVYIILAFKKGMNTIVNVVVCVIIGAILLMQGPKEIGTQLYASIGSFLGLVGMMIMCGSGLGAVLRKTGVAGNIVNFLINKVGVSTPKRAILSAMICSDLMVVMLGTLAGANAVIAPIVIPLVAIVGLTPWTISVIFQGAGQAALFLSPISAATMVLMEATGATYPQILLWAGIPLFLVMNIGTYFVACKVQKGSAGKVAYSEADINSEGGGAEAFVMTPEIKRSSLAFAATMIIMVTLGIFINGGAAFAVVIMMVTAVITGKASGLHWDNLISTFCDGCGRLVHLFIMFVLFDMFLVYVTSTGAFGALVTILEPLAMSAGKVVFALVVTLIGIFGVQGAAVAQVAVITALFQDMVVSIGLSVPVWAMCIVVGSQVTSFAYPGSDMMGAMGIARCDSIKPMMRLAYTAIIPGTVLLTIVWTLLFG